ncbi:MAG: cobalamin-binding domain-containing protein [Armatimonadetes bacterium]|nr:cobalamin-binding domain-containing protein [Armatimonadota bacterium]
MNAEDLIVGGVAASLFPEYVLERSDCKLLTGLLDQGGELDPGSPPLSSVLPDYSLLDSIDYSYSPTDAYFVKITVGCVRKCKFCAVPILEPKFGFSNALKSQLRRVESKFGSKQHLIVMDNNILGVDEFPTIIGEIADAGFEMGARRNKRKRSVDFNQGLDCRLITREKAELLSKICIDPVRLAFDHDGIEKPYRAAIGLLSEYGLKEFTNYLLFNFIDQPESLYKRMLVNMDLADQYGVAVTAFPMRFVPMNDVNKRHVSKGWHWRHLRGMQCVLLATRGVVSPSPKFFFHAFGDTPDRFKEILSMPDRYIVWRKAYETQGAQDWRKSFRKLNESDRADFLVLLEKLNKSRQRKQEVEGLRKFRGLVEHYYPGGNTPDNKPPEVDLGIQGLATGYDYALRSRRSVEPLPD